MSKEEFYSNAIDLSNENEVNNLIIKNQERTITKLKEENKILKDKIDKTIEYCEEITSREIDISDTDYDLGQDFTARDILDILRGIDNENN